jgi:flagellar basal body P-ring formation protein FlgA
MMFFAPFALSSCLTVAAGAAEITAGDLRLDGVPPATVLSFAPAPGSQRVFHVSELRQIAARFHLSAIPEDDICIERVMAPLDPAKLLDAMSQAVPEASIEILEFSKQPAPEGEIIFRRAGLRNSVSGATWFGAIRYAPNREFTIWARVGVTVRVPRVIAVTDLPPGKPIEAGQVKVAISEEFPSSQPLVPTLDEAVGRYPRAAIRAGTPLRLDAIEPPRDVRPGDVVTVEVQSGNARLKFEARAETSGAIGDMIAVRNPVSSKRFQARIEAKGKVCVDATVMP